MRDIVIGTAGHIDHGKTTIVQKLTGIDTDVLPEEKKRGITINIGFSYLNNNKGKRIGIIDVPGHEKFIKNMVAGANGIQYLLMVIACDDGIMQQTKEHFNICQLLGIKKGMIVLTKADLCTDERVEEVKKEVREYFKETFLEDSLIVVTSLNNENSYIELKDKLLKNLDDVLKGSETKDDFKLSIDRVFSVKGFGVVITGTSLNNSVSVGDTLMLYPQNKKVRVKRIENHGNEVETLAPGNRCALNLAGVDVDELKRGDILSKNFNLKTTNRIDVYFTLLKTSKKIKNATQVRLDIGTKEVFVKIKIFEKNEILPGESVFAQLELKDSLLVMEGEIGIIRSMSPITTMGGIRVINTNSIGVKRNDFEYIERLKIKNNGNETEKIKNFLKEKKEILINLVNIDVDSDKLEKIEEVEKVIYLNIAYYGLRTKLEEKKEEIKKFFKEFYSRNPLKKYISKAEIKSQFFKEDSLKNYNAYMEYLKEKDILEFNRDQVSLKNYEIKLNKDQKKIKDEILITLKKAGFHLMRKNEILKMKEWKDIFEYLLDKGLIVYLGDEYYILSGFFKESEKILREFLEKNRKIKLSEYKEELKISRREALIILENFDKLGITLKIEDYRVLGREKSESNSN